MKYYTIYKTTNLLNNMYYIGFHITDDLNDDYLGSGSYLNRAINKYGRENFKKEILFIFNSFEEMVDKEKEIITKDFVEDKMTYNLNLGGLGSFYYINLNSHLFKEKKLESYRNTLETTNLRQRLRDATKQYAENNKEKVKETNKRASETRINKSDEEKAIIKKKKQDTHEINYNTEEGLIKRAVKSKRYKELYHSEEGVLIKNKISTNVKKSTFMNYIYNEYEQYKEQVLSLVINSNLLDKEICTILNIPFGLISMLKRFELKGYIKNIKSIKVNDMSHPVITKKTICDLDNFQFTEDAFYTYKYLREDYLKCFNENYKYFIGNFSDSYIYNTLNIQNYFNILKYLEYLNIITIKQKERINIRHLFPNSQRATGLKTIIELNKNFEQNYKLIIKETCNEYAITPNFNGESIPISWDRL